MYFGINQTFYILVGVIDPQIYSTTNNLLAQLERLVFVFKIFFGGMVRHIGTWF